MLCARRSEDADQAVEKFRTQSGLLQGTRGERLSDQQISELSSQLMLARSSRAESEARLSQMRNLARSDAMASLAEVVNSPLISTLITQETEVKRKMAQLSQEYGSRHPVLINAKAELQDLRAKIDLEVKRIVQSLQNEIAVANAREQSLQRSLEQFGTRMSKSNSDEVTLRALERDADAARSTLETFLQQAHQLNAQDALRAQQPDVTLISYAPIPSEPSFPRRLLLVALAAVVSGLIAVVLVLIIEQLDVGFRSSEQLEQAFGIPVLGSVPELERSRRNNKKRVARYVLEQPTSSFAEAIRRAHTKLLHEPTIRTVQLTSAEPGEGKTTLALNLAQTDARLGRRVLLVDADFRRSQVADILELRKSPGLIDVLTERARFEHAVQTDKSGADVLVAGGFEPSASEMLVLRNLAPLLSSLREQYDLIIFDTPPVISLVDAAVVAGLVDRTILVVRWARNAAVGGESRAERDRGGRWHSRRRDPVDGQCQAALRYILSATPANTLVGIRSTTTLLENSSPGAAPPSRATASGGATTDRSARGGALAPYSAPALVAPTISRRFACCGGCISAGVAATAG